MKLNFRNYKKGENKTCLQNIVFANYECKNNTPGDPKRRTPQCRWPSMCPDCDSIY